MVWFEDAFSALPDPRTGNAERHDLPEVLTIALTASICGAESCSDFADFAVDREDLFREFPDLRNGVPSHDTFSRIFRLLDPAAFEQCFGRFVEDLGEAGAGVVAIDGKTLRRSFDRAAGRSPPAVVTAFSSSSSMVVGQESYRSGDGDSEIVAARALLSCLDLSGKPVTADALHCQEKTARLILERGGDYLLALKTNQAGLRAAAAEFFADPHLRGQLASAETHTADHGRIEHRRAWVCRDVSRLSGPKNSGDDLSPLPETACIGMIEATVVRDGKTHTTRHYHVASRDLAPDAHLAAARAQWSIETGLHWILDVIFQEDQARNRKDKGPENLATLRKLALNMLRKSRPNIAIRRKRKRAGWSNSFARDVIGQMR